MDKESFFVSYGILSIASFVFTGIDLAIGVIRIREGNLIMGVVFLVLAISLFIQGFFNSKKTLAWLKVYRDSLKDKKNRGNE